LRGIEHQRCRVGVDQAQARAGVLDADGGRAAGVGGGDASVTWPTSTALSAMRGASVPEAQPTAVPAPAGGELGLEGGDLAAEHDQLLRDARERRVGSARGGALARQIAEGTGRSMDDARRSGGVVSQYWCGGAGSSQRGAHALVERRGDQPVSARIRLMSGKSPGSCAARSAVNGANSRAAAGDLHHRLGELASRRGCRCRR
jgi:hypothetical protein